MTIGTGKDAKAAWGIPAEHVLYREDGTFYNLLKRFPGAYADAHGYVVFKTERDYRDCGQLQIGKKVAVPAGIATIPGYVLKRRDVSGYTIDLEDGIEAFIGLERDLQNALRSNIQQLEDGLEIADGGREQVVPSGRIDITAKDKKGTIVVIELKAGDADRNAVAQVLSYMGDLIAKDAKKAVRGIVVAEGFRVSALAAARVVSNVELKKYNMRFSFEDAVDFVPTEDD